MAGTGVERRLKFEGLEDGPRKVGRPRADTPRALIVYDPNDTTRPLPWERQALESTRAFQAFCAYRDMPVGQRSLETLYQSHITGYSKQVIKTYAARNKWNDRVTAYDDYIDKVRLAKRVDAIIEMEERHADLAKAAQSIVISRLETLAADPGELTPADVIKWLDTAVKVERLSMGVSTTNQAQHVSGPQGAAIQVTGKVEHEHTVQHEGSGFTGEVLRILVESGAIQPPVIEGTYTEIDEVHTESANGETGSVSTS